MFRKKLSAAVLRGALILNLTSCATAYKGPNPDFTLSWQARTQEIENFSLTEGFFNQSPYQFMMGPAQTAYFTDSLRPIMQDVSPRAIRRLEKAKIWDRVAQGALLVSAVVLISEFVDGDDRFFSHEQAIAYWAGLGLSFTASMIRTQQLNRAAHEYNEDLRAKFTPTVGMNFTY